MLNLLSGAIGLVIVGFGMLLGLGGVATLAYGGFIGLYGEGHYPRWLALIILPIGGLLSWGAYGAVRLGMDAIRPPDAAGRNT